MGCLVVESSRLETCRRKSFPVSNYALASSLFLIVWGAGDLKKESRRVKANGTESLFSSTLSIHEKKDKVEEAVHFSLTLLSPTFHTHPLPLHLQPQQHPKRQGPF